MADEFQQKKQRLDDLLANGSIGKNEYDKYVSLLNQQNRTPAATSQENAAAVSSNTPQEDSSAPEATHEKRGCLDKTVFELMKSKGLINEQEFANINGKYFGVKPVKAPKPTFSFMKILKWAGIAIAALFGIMILLGIIASASSDGSGGGIGVVIVLIIIIAVIYFVIKKRKNKKMKM